MHLLSDIFRLRVSKIVAAVVVVALATLVVACSPKKNNAATRKYQEFITRYNIYYNGDKHYTETLADMESKYEDDYSRLVLMHPIQAKGQEGLPQPSGDFNRSIEKAQKAIQLRSIKKKPAKKSGKSRDPEYKAWMKREEYNPFLHNVWLMMGRSQFYNGDFLGAASTFFYISKHFPWLPKTVTEAKIMQAMSYISMDWQFEAEMILTRIKHDDLTTNRLRRLYNFAYADFYIHAANYEEAVPFLVEAVKGAKGAQKTRLNFLLGQVYQRLGRNAEAYKAFAAAGSSASTTYRTKFNARIKQSEVFAGDNIEQEVKALRRMTRYDRNKDYLDQIYYAIGNLYLSRGDTVSAIENYEIANEKSTRNGIDKAMNQLILGGLYFGMRNYEKAQPNYAEAVPLLPSSYPDLENIKRRSDVLDELAVYSQNVNLQDSLLRLAAMSPAERDAVIEKLIKEFVEKEKKEAEEARRQDYLAEQAANGNKLEDNNTPSFTINSDNSWYFYNTATKNAGKTEFQKRWGSRKLEDDWRRRNKTSFNTSDFDSAQADESDEENPDGTEDENVEPEMTEEEKEKEERKNDPHFPEYYLAQIPQTDEEKATSHDVIQEGLYNMGVILKDKLEDYDASQAEFDRLLADYPDNTYRLDVYYNLYLMYLRMGRAEEAEHYRRLILGDFADSKYGIALKDRNYVDKLRDMDAIQQQLYDSAFNAYMENRNSDVHLIYEKMNEEYPLSKLMPKFMFLHALAYVTEKKNDEFNTTLRELLERYPDTDITPFASAWLKGMAQGRQLQTAGSNMRGMIWDTRLTNDSTSTAYSDSLAQFELNPDARQTLVFTFATDKVASNELLYEIARHNFRSFVVKDFDLEPMNFGRLGMIVVRGFDNIEELNHYRKVMASNPDFKLPSGVRPIAISETNLKLMLEQGRSFDEYFRYLEEQNYVDAQAGLLAPEDLEILDEAESAADSLAEPSQTAEPEQEPAEPEQEPSASKPEAPSSEPANSASAVPKTPNIPETPKNSRVPDNPTTPGAAASKPQAQPQPKPTPAPILPGSEGDDPLFDE